MSQLTLRFTQRNGRTILAERRVLYPYAITAPINRAGMAELTLQSVSGGIYGGETLCQSIDVSENASAKLIQPAATSIRRKHTEAAIQNIALRAEQNANLVYLTRPLIMFPGAALTQSWAIILAPGARIILFDGFLPRLPQSDWQLSTRLSVHTTAGKLLAAERMEVNGATLKNPAAFGKFWCLGQPMPPRLPAQPETETGLTALPNNAGFTIAIAAPSGGALCAAMAQILTTVTP